MAKVLLFDFDGTIADSFDNFLDILDELAALHNFSPLKHEEMESLRSEDARTLIKHLKIPFYKIPFIARDMKRLQHDHIAQIKPYKGWHEVLTKIQKKGYRLGIITSNGEANVKQFLKANDLDVFETIHSDTNLFGKATALRKYLKQNSLQKEDVLYVGDEIRDIQACHKVGIQMIAVTWGFNSKAGLTKHNPDFLIDKPEELLRIISY